MAAADMYASITYSIYKKRLIIITQNWNKALPKKGCRTKSPPDIIPPPPDIIPPDKIPPKEMTRRTKSPLLNLKLETENQTYS